MASRISALETALAERGAKISVLVDQVAILVTQVEPLTEELRRNSKNSHKAPSSDGPGSARGSRRKKKPKSGKKHGDQKGHRGAHRELCRSSGSTPSSTSFAKFVWGARPTFARLLTWTHAATSSSTCAIIGRTYRVSPARGRVQRCGAGTRVPFDSNKIPSSAFGPRLTTVAGLQTGVYISAGHFFSASSASLKTIIMVAFLEPHPLVRLVR